MAVSCGILLCPASKAGCGDYQDLLVPVPLTRCFVFVFVIVYVVVVKERCIGALGPSGHNVTDHTFSHMPKTLLPRL